MKMDAGLDTGDILTQEKTVIAPEDNAQTLHDRLKEQGFVIYAGQGPLESKIFRVANMGALSEADLTGFLAAFQTVVETSAVRT